MTVAINTLNKKPVSPLELLSIKMYSTGIKGKTYTKKFYKAMNHNFGVEIHIKNNTTQTQPLRIGGCIYDSTGKTVIQWKGKKTIAPKAMIKYDFYIKEEDFTHLKDGEYKVQFWVNDKKVQKEFFNIMYK